MEWYQGGIAEAVTESRKNESIFVVYIEGKDDKSKHVSETINTPLVADMLNSRHFTAIRVESGSVSHQQFSEIYKQTTFPSIYFIGKTGAPLEIITDASLNPAQMGEKINQILVLNGGQPVEPRQLEEPKEDVASVKDDVPQEMETKVLLPPNEHQDASTSSSQAALAMDEKLRIAQELIAKKRKEKDDEEKEKERTKELERRQLGRDVQEMRRWQQDQELKNLMTEREKERQADLEARERVRQQIKEDKREKAARMNNLLRQQQETPADPPKKVITRPASSDTRLQFRLPDGSQITHDFKSAACLQEVIDYLQLNANLRDFILSTTFPKREFTVNDASMSLLDLQLVPNAAVLVLPRARSTIASPPSGGIMSMLWYIMTPIFSIIAYLKSFIGITQTARAPPPPPPTTDKGVNPETDQASGSGSATRRIPGENKVKKQGNIHRLNDHDSDEDNNTWNGNSTQQM